MPVNRQKTILVADDEALVLEVLEWGLRNAGYQVLTAVNGQEAVSVFKASANVDLVVLDMQMPIMDGYQAYFQLKQIDPNLRVIVITGYEADDLVNTILADGPPHRLLRKPFRLKELVTEVEKSLI